VIAVDTSVVVAGFASWHEGHRAAVAALGRRPRLPAHAGLESFSVLTRLPPPHRVRPDLVAEFLRARFDEPLLLLPASAHLRLIDEATEAGIVGGAVYDALVGASVRHAGATLLTRDHRAVRVYELLGVSFELVNRPAAARERKAGCTQAVAARSSSSPTPSSRARHARHAHLRARSRARAPVAVV
jgi:predicted nucleic acid-binding protein